MIVEAGGLSLWLDSQRAPARGEGMSGLICEDHHVEIPEEVPPTRGRIRRIDVATHTYTREDRAWHPVAGQVALREVSASPRSFANDEIGLDSLRSETGLLILFEPAGEATIRENRRGT